ncbi:MAG: hypothetical protein IPH45_11015 [Bacteroidales bacterium]|nr:hypothetical protein [Bacteroidales bacterium]MBK7174875.1 hypothetical protein [Bacteroidales bacterium]
MTFASSITAISESFIDFSSTLFPNYSFFQPTKCW